LVKRVKSRRNKHFPRKSRRGKGATRTLGRWGENRVVYVTNLKGEQGERIRMAGKNKGADTYPTVGRRVW